MATTYIPLDQSESAELNEPNTILPKFIYEDLVTLISEAVKAIGNTDQNKLERSHKAISIDGERGSGKTSILVNLKSYIRNTDNKLLTDIHILDPIDPTLLEDGESLFLHVIVAAILHDDEIKKAQASNVQDARSFSHTLEKLANALESVDAQKDLYGMDKIRSLYGNKHLVNCVTEFFKSTLVLLGKKLLVLPIDDVDTSLNLAFENLEIIRRYLVAPCVLPIVSGDRKLYDEVCWRDFHGRLTKDSSYQRLQAFNIAQDLANEYQRKILPLPRRLSMPSVESYWNDPEIKLGSNNSMPLRNLIAWLEIFISGPVNGLENSKLPLPIPSVRALTQFIGHCGSLIENLPREIREAKEPLEVQRLWQIPSVPTEAIESFRNEYQRIHYKTDRDYKSAYNAFNESLEGTADPDTVKSEAVSTELIRSWVDSLSTYFQHEPRAGAINLTLQAKQYWLRRRQSPLHQTSLFATPLFQPLSHSKQFKLSELDNDLTEWKTHLEGRLPASWIDEISNQKTVLPYPVAEIGVNSALKWDYWKVIKSSDATEDQKNKAIFFISALCHRNYYTKNKRSMMLNIGRIFEVVIASLVSEPESYHFDSIRQRAPFYSTGDVAPTKTLNIKDERKRNFFFTEDSSNEAVNGLPSEVHEQIDFCWQILLAEIIEWRKDYEVDKLNISPWLVYKVFNKVFSQVANDDYYSNGMTNINNALDIAGRAFFGTWSAFGSFEKGELFGLPTIVANTNIHTSRNFELNNEHFSQNILPFSVRLNASNEDTEARKDYGRHSKTITYALSGHPIRKWLNELFQFNWPSSEMFTPPPPPPVPTPARKNSISPHKQAISNMLKIDPQRKFTTQTILEAMENLKWTKAEFLSHFATLQEEFSDKKLNAFINAGEQLPEERES
ncbi:hypothetical protein W04_1702 [Pseudoalteromonas sp. SW0106-04]|uniref:antiviral RADAR system adenosine triphosphatase RdrA n=1 Tax=Pseudoalteromonas sp. SW0106-04 TaxID=1702169 RepID=UPI0006B522AC|nr:antiviral RADAR system adenosine triphosphatase RdrA [Pseudoalteromonas sp. SW0106-04]GAP75182.1 hypothetical protein W04_1702 [Pseudoalteromonas sp. SW0106-04]